MVAVSKNKSTRPTGSLRVGDRVTHPTIPGIGIIKRVLRRGTVQVEFPGLDDEPIISRIPAEVLTLAEDFEEDEEILYDLYATDEQTAEEVIELGSEFKVGDRVICRDHPHSMDDWIVKEITKKKANCYSPSIQRWAKLDLADLEAYTPEKAFPKFKAGDKVRDIADYHEGVFTVTQDTFINGMTPLNSTQGIGYSLHCSELILAEEEASARDRETKGEFKVGDRVIVENNCYGKAGNEAVITQVQENNWYATSEGCYHGKYLKAIATDNKDPVVIETPTKSITTTITPTEIIPSDPQQRLLQLENDIQEGLNLVEQGKARIWQAAAAIQQEELWKLAGHSSFEAYCKARWGWERSNAYEVAAAGEVVNELRQSGIPDSELPTSVSQVRELKKLPPEQRAEALQEAIATTEGKPTAKAIKAAVAARKPGIVSDFHDDYLAEGEAIKQGRDSSLKESDENYTPPELVEPARRVLGEIDLDPASCELANQTVKAVKFYDRHSNGLNLRWYGRVWLNAPYSQPLIRQFSNRLLQHWSDGSIEGAICLTNNCTDTQWFQALSVACTVRLDLKGRYQFYNPYKSYDGIGNRQGQTLFYFGSEPERFYQEFEGKGLFYPAPPVALPVYKSTLTAEEFRAGMEAASAQFSGCLSCTNHALNEDGSRYRCEAGEFDEGIHTLPIKQNWMVMNEGCKSYSAPGQRMEAIATTSNIDRRAGIPAIREAVWEWLNLNGLEVDESTANAAADSIHKFLKSQFLEVMNNA